MPKETTIICDYCKEDLTSTDKMPKFRLHLSAEALPHTTKAAIIKRPAIKEDAYFCNLACLASWVYGLATV